MSVDDIIERRHLRRSRAGWRLAAALLVVALVGLAVARAGLFAEAGRAGDHIARVAIEGVITDDEKLLKLLKDLGGKEQVRAVILDISSPGGTTVGGEAIFEAVRDLAGKKPVATTVGTLAASAGYMIACASDHIVARRSSIVGSIGVIFQFPEVSGLLGKLGVKVEEVKSAPLKAEPSPFHPAPPEARAMIARLVQDSYQWFVDLVAERRGMSVEAVRVLADGSIFTGAQGLSNGLVDEMGDEDTAKAWLAREKGLATDLKVIEWKPEKPDGPLGLVSGALARLAGLAGLVLSPAELSALERRMGLEPLGETGKRLFLDGLLSLMQSPALPVGGRE